MATYKEWAMKMIPVLVRWAQSSWDKPHYYSQLSKAVGLKTSQIGGIMGTIQDILDDVKEQTGWKDIPPLNGLVQSKETNLPSDGFDYIVPDYSKLSFASKKGEVHKLNEKAHKYEWARVLDFLNLKPAIIFEKEDLENPVCIYENKSSMKLSSKVPEGHEELYPYFLELGEIINVLWELGE